jgi:hypothetical protein
MSIRSAQLHSARRLRQENDMRSLWRCMTLLMLAAPLATVAAIPAHARSTVAAGPPAATTVCDRAVCESVTGVGLTVRQVKANAYASRTVCGHFTMTIATTRTRSVTNSPPSCASQPSYLFAVHKTFPVGTTIDMQFTSPLTPGRPVVRLPLR